MFLDASGKSVGLPDGQMGNSEVGHLNMGAGRIVYQELTRITKEINDGDFFKNEAILAGMNKAKENGITKEEIVEIITQLAFYVGWPKAWSAFNIAKEIYKD